MKAVWLGIVTLFMQAATAQETFSASAALDAVVDAAADTSGAVIPIYGRA